jgi:GntR family transcriptional regulator
MLNPNSSIPLYQQLADRLTAAIRRGDFATDSRIPSEPTLACEYGIGRPTVRQATELLVRQGLLERRRGAGTFVRQPPPEVAAFSLQGTLASFAEQGIAVRVEPLEVPRLQTICAENNPEHPFAGRNVWTYSRLSHVEEGPALLERTWLDPDAFPGIQQLALGTDSLARLLEQHYGETPTGGRQQFHAMGADDSLAKALQLTPGSPLLQVRRSLDFARGSNALYTELYCNTDRIRLAQHLGANGGF